MIKKKFIVLSLCRLSEKSIKLGAKVINNDNQQIN